MQNLSKKFLAAIALAVMISLEILLFVDTTVKLARKPVKKQKENPAGCAGEGKQSKGNIGEEKRTIV